MKGFMGGFAVIAIASSLSVSEALAQCANMPVYFSPAGRPGVTISGDVGIGLSDDAELYAGETPTAYGGSIVLGLPVAQIGACANVVNPNDPNDAPIQDSELAFGGKVAIALFNAPLTPVAVNLQGGVGYIKFGEGTAQAEQLDVPIGIGIALKPMTSGITFEPWVAPRVHIQRRIEGLDEAQTELGFGASGGLTITLINGIGAHLALDYLTIDFGDGTTVDTRESIVVFGAGLHVKFSVPSLGAAGSLLGG